MKSTAAASALALGASSLAAAVPIVPHFRLHDHHEQSQQLRNEHQVESLPGISREHVPFDHFAGQLHLPTDTQERLFYWYTESKDDPSSDPIVLWLNGGPGCASSSGFLTENGPFVAQPDATVRLNPYAWNRKANVVWVDSPAGVGFSGDVQDGGSDYYNDDVVADRLHTFLTVFFDKYPELKDRDFYITGESYAGMYIPFLVNRLVEDPIEGVNLKGFAIGNPLTDNVIDGSAYLDYYETHALISRQTHRSVRDDFCDGDSSQCMFSDDNCSESCANAVARAFASASADNFNHYYIYGDVCLLNSGQEAALLVHHNDRIAKFNAALADTSDLKLVTKVAKREVVGPCADTFTYNLLNRPEVQEALHVEGAPVEWVDCKHDVSHVFRRAPTSLPKYRNILGRGLKALIYSGDADSVVNFMGTERWISEEGLNLTEVEPWKAWFGPDQQIAGYVQQYDGLAFRTVKGAGHMVPAVRPLHALHMFECFLYGEEACSGFEYPTDTSELVAAGVIANNKVSGAVSMGVSSPVSATQAHAFSLWTFVGCALVVLVAGLFATLNNRRRSRHRGLYQSIPGSQ